MRVSLAASIGFALLLGHGAAMASDGASASSGLVGAWQDGPAGLYCAQSYDPAAGGLDRRTYLFAGDRWAENPAGNLDSFDFDSANPAMSGRWTLSGDTLSLTPADGPPREGKAVLNPDTCFDFRDGVWCPAVAFGTSSLDGKYSGGASYTGSSSASSVATDYEFLPDGTYRLLAAGSFKDPQDPGSRVTSAGESEGRYRIEGLTLILTASDGTERREIAFPVIGEGAGGSQPAMIYFGGWLLTRQN